jgi:hypothetical protein
VQPVELFGERLEELAIVHVHLLSLRVLMSSDAARALLIAAAQAGVA